MQLQMLTCAVFSQINSYLHMKHRFGVFLLQKWNHQYSVYVCIHSAMTKKVNACKS